MEFKGPAIMRSRGFLFCTTSRGRPAHAFTDMGETPMLRGAAMDTVRIFDTTLRDGEQSPGATLTRPEKVEIARHLESMGVDIIEAGFPIASDGDFESVRAIAGEISKAT